MPDIYNLYMVTVRDDASSEIVGSGVVTNRRYERAIRSFLPAILKEIGFSRLNVDLVSMVPSLGDLKQTRRFSLWVSNAHTSRFFRVVVSKGPRAQDTKVRVINSFVPREMSYSLDTEALAVSECC